MRYRNAGLFSEITPQRFPYPAGRWIYLLYACARQALVSPAELIGGERCPLDPGRDLGEPGVARGGRVVAENPQSSQVPRRSGERCRAAVSTRSRTCSGVSTRGSIGS